MIKLIKCLFIFIIIIILSGCTEKIYSNDYFYMDTSINVKLYDVGGEKSEEIFKRIDDILNEYHVLTDRYKQYDMVNIYYLNNILEPNEEVIIDKKLYNIIEYGLNAYEETEGKVNIAIGNAIDLWEQSEENQTLPTEKELSKSKNYINNIRLNDGYFIKHGDVKLDLGSYAKGYVTEIISDYLLENNIESYIINFGGNVRVGKKKSNDKFIIGIEDPASNGNIIEIVKSNDVSVVTSGSYERFYSINGNHYSHIINSDTLYPSNTMKSVTVVTKNSGKADILSTYLYQLTVEEAIEYANNVDDIEIFIIDNKNNKYYSKGFKYE